MIVITKKEAAKRLGVCEMTLSRLISEGEGPATIRLARRRVGILESDLAAWIVARRKPSPSMASNR